MAGEQPGVQIAWYQVSVIERFSSVLYPLDIFELLRQIPTIGYVVPELVLSGTPEQGKPIASTSEGVELLINQDNKTIGVRAIGVRGQDTGKVIESFRKLRQFYLERLDHSPGLTTHYLEFNGQGSAKARANPTEVCSRFWANYAPLQQLSKLLEVEVTNFGLQLAPPNRDPNDPSWFHIYIEPLVVSSSTRYRIQWIWRGPDIEALLTKFSKIDETVQKLISRLEGQ